MNAISKPLPKEKISKQRIVRDLNAMGVNKGDYLSLGISFKSIGFVTGGPEKLIDALLETVGPEGTIMMNTFTEFFYPTEVDLKMVDYVFDVESTSVNTGIIPETFRKRNDAVRSRHPIVSVAAIGRMAEFLTEDHDETADAYLPFSKISEINGKYLAIGINDRLVGIRHQAQHLAGLLDVVPWRRCVRYKARDGEIKIFTFKDRGGCVKRLPELVSHLRTIGLVKDDKIGMANAVLVPAKKSLAVMAELLTQNPSINLCDSVWCLWCRELESRLDLYDRIERPRYFQKNIAIRKLVGAMNRVREKDNRAVTRFKLFVKENVLQRLR
jgi:aminoglycoside N3'-acetyltransferase